MHKHRITFKTGQIRRINRFLRYLANTTESDSLAHLYEASLVKSDRGNKATLKGTQ